MTEPKVRVKPCDEEEATPERIAIEGRGPEGDDVQTNATTTDKDDREDEASQRLEKTSPTREKNDQVSQDEPETQVDQPEKGDQRGEVPLPQAEQEEEPPILTRHDEVTVILRPADMASIIMEPITDDELEITFQNTPGTAKTTAATVKEERVVEGMEEPTRQSETQPPTPRKRRRPIGDQVGVEFKVDDNSPLAIELRREANRRQAFRDDELTPEQHRFWEEWDASIRHIRERDPWGSPRSTFSEAVAKRPENFGSPPREGRTEDGPRPRASSHDAEPLVANRGERKGEADRRRDREKRRRRDGCSTKGRTRTDQPRSQGGRFATKGEKKQRA
ncbi:PREDICTED: uncharacterized protein LOC108763157 [Trachymyrmex cornetzi]|uniref:uncharacterized protein LOC108763157 n=1 Tax=Trachymyrmex cornetzi TaxID=471704 RepID=UPI00084F767C|nr:PREDICTED: uncharacterized protein LOC108763157 [Trachymyrmex cornetzi]